MQELEPEIENNFRATAASIERSVEDGMPVEEALSKVVGDAFWRNEAILARFSPSVQNMIIRRDVAHEQAMLRAAVDDVETEVPSHPRRRL